MPLLRATQHEAQICLKAQSINRTRQSNVRVNISFSFHGIYNNQLKITTILHTIILQVRKGLPSGEESMRELLCKQSSEVAKSN